MFPAYPGFENLPLRVEVEWQGRKRWVVARLECWPESREAVVVCTVEDDEGKWLITGSGGLPYFLGNPHKKVNALNAYNVSTREPSLVWKRGPSGVDKLEAVLHKAFMGSRNYGIGRLLRLDDLPAPPRVALRTTTKSVWLPDYDTRNWIEFEGQTDVALTQSKELTRLQEQWHHKTSDVYVSWEWTSLEDEQRKRRVGFAGDSDELRQVMSRVLTARSRQWKTDDWITWAIQLDAEKGQFYGEFYNAGAQTDEPPDPAIAEWEKFLIARYTTNPNAQWLSQHSCVRQYINSSYHHFGDALQEQPPTAHEQLEAKLALRDWLQDKATPAEIEQLLAL